MSEHTINKRELYSICKYKGDWVSIKRAFRDINGNWRFDIQHVGGDIIFHVAESELENFVL